MGESVIPSYLIPALILLKIKSVSIFCRSNSEKNMLGMVSADVI